MARDPLHDVVTPVQDGSVFQMQTGLFRLGHKRALQSGTVEARSEDVEALTEHAQAMARQTYRDKFDPSQNAHDAMHQAEYRRTIDHRTQAETAERHAYANLRDVEIDLARTPDPGLKPDVHPLTIAAFTIVIMVTVAPTLHDLLAIDDELLAWFAAIMSSAFVGFMVTWAILNGRRSKWEWIGVTAGVILGLGLGVVRFSAVDSAGEKGFVIGLTVVEIATVLLLEWLASGLRTRDEEWLPKHAAKMQAIASRDAAQADLYRWKAKVKELDDVIAAKIALVERRHDSNIHLPELQAIAAKAVMDGYNADITENIGRLRGVPYATRRML